MLRLRLPIVLLALVAAAALAPVAVAQRPSSAQRMADAVERGKSAIRAKAPEYKAAFAAIELERCIRVLASKEPPKRAAERADAVLLAALSHPIYGPTKPVLRQIVADLQVIPTSDPALKSGRAAWRRLTEIVEQMPTLDKPCEQLERWAASGWNASAAPKIDAKLVARVTEQTDSPELQRKIDRAARRMRQLGVSRGDARRFTGETLLDDVIDEAIEKALEDAVPGAGAAVQRP
jgi:hypothetical protein